MGWLSLTHEEHEGVIIDGKHFLIHEPKSKGSPINQIVHKEGGGGWVIYRDENQEQPESEQEEPPYGIFFRFRLFKDGFDQEQSEIHYLETDTVRLLDGTLGVCLGSDNEFDEEGDFDEDKPHVCYASPDDMEVERTSFAWLYRPVEPGKKRIVRKQTRKQDALLFDDLEVRLTAINRERPEPGSRRVLRFGTRIASFWLPMRETRAFSGQVTATFEYALRDEGVTQLTMSYDMPADMNFRYK